MAKRLRHHNHIHVERDMNNNMMERINGEFRDWKETRRGLKKPDTLLIDGIITYCAKQHSALGGRTPVEAALIRIRGRQQVGDHHPERRVAQGT